IEDRVRLFCPSAEDPARAMVFETAADHAHAVREQCGGETVARETGEIASLPGEADRARAVDASTGGQAGAGQAAVPRFRVESTTCETVSRSITNHWPQPPAWHHSSVCAPFSLLRR